MPRPIRPWFRLYVEAFSDRKLRRLTPAQRWIWCAILGAARDSPEPGVLLVVADVAMTFDELADFADVKRRDVPPAITAMQALGLIDVQDGVITVPAFGRRQYESDNVTARTQKHRARNVPTEDVGTFQPGSQERSGNGHGNGPETETETEKKTSSSSARSRATRIPTDWKPTETDVAWQRDRGISDLLARRQLERFTNYWTAKAGRDGTKLDWSATWRNWLLTEQDRQRPPAAAATAHPSQRNGWEFGMDR